MTPIPVTWFDADAADRKQFDKDATGPTRSGMLIDTLVIDGRTHGVVIEGDRFSTPKLYALRVKETV
jgi:hypothetical protein